MAKLHVTTTINGEPTEFLCEPRQSLLEVLRDRLGLTGSKEGCNNGNCGACSVIARRPAGELLPGAGRRGRGQARSTRSRAWRDGDELHPLQQTFLESGAAVRHLHAGLHRGGEGAAGEEPEPDRGPRSASGWPATSAAAPATTRSSARSRTPRRTCREACDEHRYTTTDNAIHKSIGTRPIRHDGVDKVTGRAVYGADVQCRACCTGKSCAARMRTRASGRSTRARRWRCRAWRRWSRPRTSPTPDDSSASSARPATCAGCRNVLARDKVLLQGPRRRRRRRRSTRTSPTQALELIEVDYELLPRARRRRGDEARRAAAARRPVTERWASRASRPTSPSTSSSSIGDVETGFAEAAVVVEREFHTATSTRATSSRTPPGRAWSADGNVTIWCSTQGAFTVRARCAELLRHPDVATSRSCRRRSAAASAARSVVYLEPVAACWRARRAGR